MGWKGRLERQQYADAQKEEFRKDRRIKATVHEVRMREDAERARLEGRGPSRYNEHDEALRAAKLKRKEKNEKSKAFMKSVAEEFTDVATAHDTPTDKQQLAAMSSEQTLEQQLDNAMTLATAHGVLSEAQCDELTDALALGRMTSEDCLSRVELALVCAASSSLPAAT